MSRNALYLLVFLSAVALMTSCSGDSEKQTTTENTLSPEDCLAGSLADNSIERTSDIRTFVGDSLWEYINGGAEIYHQYGFEIVATADYRAGSAELVADIYKFENPAGAYGLYTALRHEDADILALGIQGFGSATSTTFAKGAFVVQLTAYEASEETSAGLAALAKALETCLSGTTARPETFTELPGDSLLPNTDRIFAQSFQGRAFLTDFYARDYSLNGDTVTLFVSLEDAASKFDQWTTAVMIDTAATSETAGILFTDGKVAVIETFYRPLLFGLDGSRLVGMINYSSKQQVFLSAWLKAQP
jgi:hypothetical protein